MYRNPIIYADYSDPDVIRVGQDYYMIASSFTYLPGVPILHSKDLVHWEIINYAVPALPFPQYDHPRHGSGTWAPSIRYHEGMFYVFVPLPDEGILVARCEDIRGQFRLNLLCKAKGWIDPCPLWDDDGRAYMVFAYARSRCGIKHRLSLVEIDPECTKLLGQPKVIFHDEALAPTLEGPKLYKREGHYYILAPAGGVATGWQAAMRSDNIWGPYEYRVVMEQGESAVNGPHQGGWITDTSGKDWFVHFQDVGALGRITHLQPMVWKDGWPVIGKDVGSAAGEPVAQWKLPMDGMPHYRIADSDDFTGETLGLQWQFQANPKAHYYRLTGHSLCLPCLPNEDRENLLWYAPNALTQIPQHKVFTATTRLALSGSIAGDFGSLGIIGHRYAYCALCKLDAGYALRLYAGVVTEDFFEGQATETVAAEYAWESDTAVLRLEVEENGNYRFFASADGQTFMPVGSAQALHCATWTGAKLCLWSGNHRNAPSRGFAEYDHLRIEP